MKDVSRRFLLLLSHKPCRDLDSNTECRVGFGAAIRRAVRLGDFGALVQSYAHGKSTIVDPKGNDFSRYYSATLIRPNSKKFGEATGRTVHDTAARDSAPRELVKTTGAEYILATRGSVGMLLVPREGAALEIPAVAREVFEVSGRGDTIAAALAAALGSGAEIVVEKGKTAVVDRSEIVHAIKNQSAPTAATRFYDPAKPGNEHAGSAWFLGFLSGC